MNNVFVSHKKHKIRVDYKDQLLDAVTESIAV